MSGVAWILGLSVVIVVSSSIAWRQGSLGPNSFAAMVWFALAMVALKVLELPWMVRLPLSLSAAAATIVFYREVRHRAMSLGGWERRPPLG